MDMNIIERAVIDIMEENRKRTRRHQIYWTTTKVALAFMVAKTAVNKMENITIPNN